MDTRKVNRYVAAPGGAVAFFLLPAAAMSQSPSMGGSASDAMQPGDRSARVDDATLQHAAKAYVAVRHITEDTKQRLARTSDSSEQQRISAQAEAQKVQVVKEAGMAPQQYNNVIIMVQNDPNLQQKFLSYVNAAGGV